MPLDSEQSSAGHVAALAGFDLMTVARLRVLLVHHDPAEAYAVAAGDGASVPRRRPPPHSGAAVGVAGVGGPAPTRRVGRPLCRHRHPRRHAAGRGVPGPPASRSAASGGALRPRGSRRVARPPGRCRRDAQRHGSRSRDRGHARPRPGRGRGQRGVGTGQGHRRCRPPRCPRGGGRASGGGRRQRSGRRHIPASTPSCGTPCAGVECCSPSGRRAPLPKRSASRSATASSPR